MEKTTMDLKKNESTLLGLIGVLIKINYARMDGYQTAHEKIIDNTDLKAIFVERSLQSLNFIAELRTLILGILGQVSEKIPDQGTVFNTWEKVKGKFNMNKNATILDACEISENSCIDAYEDILLSDTAIPEVVRQKIIEQQNEIRKSHEFIKNFRDFNLDLTN
jgi:uncharacterized protein (TIGR02284 family)